MSSSMSSNISSKTLSSRSLTNSTNLNNYEEDLETNLNVEPLSEYHEAIQDFQKDVHFILDDILNTYYPGSMAELSLHKEIAETYSIASSLQLYDLISAKTPYKRIWHIFKYFHDLLFDFIEIIEKIKALDRIHQRRKNKLEDSLISSFNEEYLIAIEDLVEVSGELSKMGIFFDYFVPNNDLLLKQLFNQENLDRLFIHVNNILFFWTKSTNTNKTDLPNETNANIMNKIETNLINASEINDNINDNRNNNINDKYLNILGEVRQTNLKNFHQIILSWKYLKKRLKKCYPTSSLWYSKRYYFDYVHELIDLLKLYHEFKETGDIDLLYPSEKKKLRFLRIRKPRFSKIGFLRKKSFVSL